MAAPKTVLIFGPTGGVGRAAALATSNRGAKVWLAMRDTDKTIEGISKDDANFPRVQADLSEPASLKAAVEKSSATAAFVYTLHDSEDHMKASFEALKVAGITYMVLLSSYSVEGPAGAESNMDNFIPRVHAQTEVSLEETGVPFTAIRPAYFNTNLLWTKASIKKGEVEILYPNVLFDFLAPEDIGMVAGGLLAKGEATKPITICGPNLYSQKEGHEILEKVLGYEIKVTEIGEERFYETHQFFPKPIADSLVNGLRKSNSGEVSYPKDKHVEAVENIRKYGGVEPTKFADWVEAHKKDFES